MSINSYFELSEKDNCVRFMGKKLICYVPERYEQLGYFKIAETVFTLGAFEMLIDDKIHCGLKLFAGIYIDPVSISHETIDGEKYLVCELHKGSRLLCSLDIMKDPNIFYKIWREYFSVGHLPRCFKYSNLATIFDDMKFTTGQEIPTDHAVAEIIYAHLFRDPKDLNVFYRHTAMNQDPKMITLRSVAYGPSGTFAKIAGSYAQEGYNSALLNQSDQPNELEDLFRS